MASATFTVRPGKTVQWEKRLLSRDEYERLVEVGILGPDDRVELIEGEIVQVVPMKSPRAACITQLIRLLGREAEDRYLVTAQTPLRLGTRNEPEPDLMLLKPKADCYRSGLPEPGDVLLVIEIADTTLELDREVKVPLYGRQGVPETWLVDLPDQRVEVYREPDPSGYKSVERLVPTDKLRVPQAEDLVLAVSDVLNI